MKPSARIITPLLVLALGLVPTFAVADEPSAFKDSPQEFGLIFRKPNNAGEQGRVQARSGGKVFAAAMEGYAAEREHTYRKTGAYPAGDAAKIEEMVKKKQAILLADGTKIEFMRSFLNSGDGVLSVYSQVKILDGPGKDKVAWVGQTECFYFDTFPLKAGDEGMLGKGRLGSGATGVAVVGEVSAYNALLRSWRDGEPDQNNGKAREAPSLWFQEPGTRVRVKVVACSPDRVEHHGLAGSAVNVEILDGPDQGKVGWAFPEAVVAATAEDATEGAPKPGQPVAKATPKPGWQALRSEKGQFTVELAGPPNIRQGETVDGAEVTVLGYRTRGLEMLVVAERRPSEISRAEETQVLRNLRDRAVDKLASKFKPRYEREEALGPLHGLEFHLKPEKPEPGQFYGMGRAFADGKMAYVAVVAIAPKGQTIFPEVSRFLDSFAVAGLSAKTKAAGERRPATPATEGGRPTWGKEVDPSKDVEIEKSGTSLTMKIPGTAHALAPGRDKMNAPRVIAPARGDFVVTVRVDGPFRPEPESTMKGLPARQAGGLILWKDAKNHLVLLHRAAADDGKITHQAVLEELVAGDKGVTHRQAIPAEATFLRLERKKGRISAAFSDDGQDWKEMKPFDATWAEGEIQVGVVAINTSTAPHHLKFDSYSLKAK